MIAHLKITDIEGATAAPARIVSRLLEQQEMHTAYERVGRGQRRRYTYVNAIELAFTYAFIKSGVKASRAVAYAGTYVLEHDIGFPSLRDYFAIPAGNTARGFATNDFGNVIAEFPDEYSLNVIATRALLARVDKFFQEHGTP